jgi:hypothetical protein
LSTLPSTSRVRYPQNMEPFHVETTVQADRSVTVVDLPNSAGLPVEVIVIPHHGVASRFGAESLRGLPLTYVNPTEPVGAEEWEASS